MMAIHLSVSFMPYLEAIIARVMCMNGSAVYKLGIKTLDQVTQPGLKLISNMVKMHNSIFQITAQIRAYVASMYGAAELVKLEPVLGLPAFEIVFVAEDGSKRPCCTLDAAKGLTIKDKTLTDGLDNETQSIKMSEILTSMAEWLLFLGQALEGKGDMSAMLIDPAGVVPLLRIGDEPFRTAAPWIKAKIRMQKNPEFEKYFFGLPVSGRIEKEIDFEEMMFRKKARTKRGAQGDKARRGEPDQAAQGEGVGALQENEEEAQGGRGRDEPRGRALCQG